jgi:hypothetical protein
LILERGRLLEQLGRGDAAAAAAQASLPLLLRQALPGAGTAPAAAPHARALQRWVLGRLLRAARLLHALGREAAAAEVLEPLPAAAAALSDAATYVAAVGQLGSPSDELLEELQRCSAVLEAGAAGTAGAAGAEDDEAAAAAAAAGDGGGDASPCPWLRGFPPSRAFPLFYALHRGLHARRQAHASMLSNPHSQHSRATPRLDRRCMFLPADCLRCVGIASVAGPLP